MFPPAFVPRFDPPVFSPCLSPPGFLTLFVTPPVFSSCLSLPSFPTLFVTPQYSRPVCHPAVFSSCLSPPSFLILFVTLPPPPSFLAASALVRFAYQRERLSTLEDKNRIYFSSQWYVISSIYLLFGDVCRWWLNTQQSHKFKVMNLWEKVLLSTFSSCMQSIFKYGLYFRNSSNILLYHARWIAEIREGRENFFSKILSEYKKDHILWRVETLPTK